jgi:hypothetical protein
VSALSSLESKVIIVDARHAHGVRVRLPAWEADVEPVWSFDPVPESIPEVQRHHVLDAQCML